jgi:hypothetical protein
MTTEQKNKLATICTRYAELNSAAKQAKNAIQDLRFKLISDILHPDDIELLTTALRIVEKIASHTQQWDAVNHFKKIS